MSNEERQFSLTVRVGASPLAWWFRQYADHLRALGEFSRCIGLGFTLTLEFKNDGTGTETTTGPDARTETFSWTEIGETICIKNSCAPFEMAANQLSFRVNFQEEAYCEDEDFNITGDDNKRACESASTSNTWVPAQCNTERYRKEMD